MRCIKAHCWPRYPNGWGTRPASATFELLSRVRRGTRLSLLLSLSLAWLAVARLPSLFHVRRSSNPVGNRSRRTALRFVSALPGACAPALPTQYSGPLHSRLAGCIGSPKTHLAGQLCCRQSNTASQCKDHGSQPSGRRLAIPLTCSVLTPRTRCH